MATIKSFTDLSQSKILADILPIQSADMGYICENFVDEDTGEIVEVQQVILTYIEHSIPCWSLAALLGVIPKHIKDFNVLRIDINEKDFSIWYDEIGSGVNTELPDITTDNLIDACVAMIIKLHEREIL